MEAELLKFRQKKQAEERNLLIKEKLESIWNRITSTLSTAVLPEPEPLKNNENASSSEEDDSSCSSSDNDEEENKNVQINSDKNLTTKVKKEKKNKSTKNTTEPSDASLLLDPNPNKWALYALRGTKCLMWILTWIGFIKIGFGAVFFAISALYFIWANTETRRKKKKGQKSAYSVFNENCQPIDGALDAKQLEKQMIFGNFVS